MHHSQKRTIAVVGGGWSTNVGNGFYNLGTIHILEKIFPEHRIVLLSDQEAYWDFRNHKTPKNSLRFLDYIHPEYVVLHGRFLTEYFPAMWGKTLRLLKERGTKVLFLSAGLEHYTETEISTCRAFVEENPPDVFVSRDAVTYSKFQDLIEHSYNGIDTAFFLTDAFPPIALELPPYIIANFDKLPEPNIRLHPAGRQHETGQSAPETGLALQTHFEFMEQTWEISFPKMRMKFSDTFGKFYKYVEALAFPGGNYQPEIGGYKIVRPDHQSNPWFVRKMYRAPNAFAWDLPQPYLALYANTQLTLSDRVHACVATLTYGKPAMLFSRTPRSLILERVGATEIKQKPVTLPFEQLQAEREKMLDFLKNVLG